MPRQIAPARLVARVPALGSLAIVVAAARGTPSAALGVVSLVGGRWRSLRGGDIDARVELDVRLHHSQQGGLALDASGEAIGMAVLGPRRVLVIPTATIERVAGRLETHGRIARGYLGVGLQAVKLDDGVGAMVMSVDKIGSIGRRRHQARRRDRRLERRKTLRRAVAVALARPRQRRLGRRSFWSDAAASQLRFKLTIGERPET